MSKLTLSVDSAVVTRAKRYAKKTGVSISEMVEAYLDSISSPEAAKVTPVLRSLRGTLKAADPEQYRKYLREKYR